MSSTYNDSFTSSLLIWIWLIIFLIWLLKPRTSNTLLNRRAESGLPCLVPDFSGKTFNISLFEYYIGCKVILNSFYYVEMRFLYIHFGKSFYHEWMLNVVKCFFLNLWRWLYGFCYFIYSCGISEWLVCLFWMILVTLGWIQLDSRVWSFLYVVGFRLFMFCWIFAFPFIKYMICDFFW